MNTRITAWDRMMGAVSFAEAGEFGTAAEIMEFKNQQPNLHSQTSLRLWDRLMAAVTFAEADESETAIQIMNRKSRQADLQSRKTISKQATKRPSLRA